MVRLCKYCLYNGFTDRFRTSIISLNIVQTPFAHLSFSPMKSLPIATELYLDYSVVSMCHQQRLNNKVEYIGYPFQ